jgi:hypothetical protein
VSTSGKDWVLTRPHDLPCGGEFAVVQWRKRRWRCRTSDCARQTFTEQVAQVPAGMRTTTRLRTALALAVEDGRDQSEVAAAHGVSWPTVQRAVVARGAVELVEPEPVGVLGMDETRFGRPRWLPDGEHPDGRVRWGRTDPWETGFVDISGGQALLGQVDGRTSAGVAAWLNAHARVPGRDRGGGDRPARRGTAYGRDPNPSDAWDHAIKAVEAVLTDVVTPNKAKATLGDVLGQLRAQGHLWKLMVRGQKRDHSVEPLVHMLTLIWPEPPRFSYARAASHA